MIKEWSAPETKGVVVGPDSTVAGLAEEYSRSVPQPMPAKNSRAYIVKLNIFTLFTTAIPTCMILILMKSFYYLLGPFCEFRF